MSAVVYRIVEHDGGWAYKLGDVFSETFPTREWAITAAERVAAEQVIPGEDEAISWQDEAGRWHNEYQPGSDRPEVSVERDPYAPLPAAPRRSRRMAALDQVRGVYDRGDEYTRKGLRVARRGARGQPFITVLLAGLFGYGLAWFIHSRDRDDHPPGGGL